MSTFNLECVRRNNEFLHRQDEEDEADSEASGEENGNEDVDMEADENQRPQADSAADDDEFNLANYDEEDGTPFIGIGDVAVIDPNENLDDDES